LLSLLLLNQPVGLQQFTDQSKKTATVSFNSATVNWHKFPQCFSKALYAGKS